MATKAEKAHAAGESVHSDAAKSMVADNRRKGILKNLKRG